MSDDVVCITVNLRGKKGANLIEKFTSTGNGFRSKWEYLGTDFVFIGVVISNIFIF